MKPQLLTILIATLSLTVPASAQSSQDTDSARTDRAAPPLEPISAYVFTSFRGNGEDGLHLASSTNGYRWTPLNGDRSFLRPTVGGRLMRDPCVIRGPDRKFHMVWTTSWTAEGNPILGYASSPDLIEWSPQRAIVVMQNEPATRNVWAPEIFHDETRREYLIFWSSTIPGKFPGTDHTGDNGYNHRIFATTTRDLQHFSESRLFYDPGFNVIDATLLHAEGQYHLFIKDERKNPLKKNLRHAIADTPAGPFGALSEPITGDWVEGPSAIRIGNEYLVYFDHYAAPHYYGAIRSTDLRAWEDCSKEMDFPPGQRHGTVIGVTTMELERLKAWQSEVNQVIP